MVVLLVVLGYNVGNYVVFGKGLVVLFVFLLWVYWLLHSCRKINVIFGF